MKRSQKWAVVRSEAPKMPWDGDATATTFPLLHKQFGSAFALRHWNLLQEYVMILDGIADDRDASDVIDVWLDRVREEHGEGVVQEFLAVLRHTMRRAVGTERRTALRAQLRRSTRR